MKTIKKIIAASLYSLGIASAAIFNPVTASAQNLAPCVLTDPPRLKDFICMAVNVATVAIWAGGAVAVIALVINAMKILMAKGDPKALANAKQGLTWSVAGLLLVLFAVTIVRLIAQLVFGLGGYTPGFQLPNIS